MFYTDQPVLASGSLLPWQPSTGFILLPSFEASAPLLSCKAYGSNSFLLMCSWIATVTSRLPLFIRVRMTMGFN